MREIKLSDLKAKSAAELLAFAEEHEVENASLLRKQELLFAILKQFASRDVEIVGEGVVEVLQDGFGFLRRAGDAAGGLFEFELFKQLGKTFPVFGQINGIWRRAEDRDTCLFQRAGKIERCLAAGVAQVGVGVGRPV